MMTLAFFLWVFLSFGIQLYVLAGPSPSTIQLPPFLSDTIPNCAHDCLTNFISNSFPTEICFSQQDRSCLCTRNSRSGFTLGEGAFRCIASSCTGEYEADLVKAYTLCSGVKSAMPMTHETITVTVELLTTVTAPVQIGPPTTTEGSLISSSNSCISTTMTPSASSNIFPSSSIHSRGSTSIPTGIITATGSPTIPHPTSTGVSSASHISSSSPIFLSSWSSSAAFATTSLPPSSINAIPAASTTPTSKSTLTRPQIAGVATAGAATAAIAIAILAFIFCCRKRRKNRDSNSSFGQDQLPDISPFPPRTSAPTVNSSQVSQQQVAEAPLKAQQVLGVPSRYNEQTWDTYNDATTSADIGVGAVPGSGHSTQSSQDTPPHSATSYRTTSRLLPDKPTISSLYPAPLNPQSSRRPESAVARSAEGGGIRLVAPDPPPKPQKAVQPQKQQVQADPFIDHSDDPRARMYAMERSARQAQQAQLPLVLTAGREQPGGSSRTLPPDSQVSEPPAVHGYRGPRWEGALPLSTADPHHIQRKPLSRDSAIGENPHRSAHPSFDPYAGTYIQSSRSGPLARRSKGVRPETYLTMGSDTSFEDDYDEPEEQPSKPNRTLSPVVEQDTPRIRSPISNIRYPPIPGAAATSIIRRQSPPSPTRRPTRRPNYPPAVATTAPPNARVRHVDFRLPSQQQQQQQHQQHQYASERRQVGRTQTQTAAQQHSNPPLRTNPNSQNPRWRPRPPPSARSTNSDPRAPPQQQQQLPHSHSHSHEGNTESAKWKILCGPGQDDVINLGSAYIAGAGAGGSSDAGQIGRGI